MRLNRCGLAILGAALLGLASATAYAQPAASRPPADGTPSPRTLSRIARGLEAPPSTVAAVLRMDLELEVFGQAPAPVWLDQADLVPGAPTYGAPTHEDMLTVVTPIALRSTAASRRLRPGLSLSEPNAGR